MDTLGMDTGGRDVRQRQEGNSKERRVSVKTILQLPLSYAAQSVPLPCTVLTTHIYKLRVVTDNAKRHFIRNEIIIIVEPI